MRTILLLSLSVFFLTESCTQNRGWSQVRGEGNIVEKTLKLDDFEGIKLTISGDVFLTQGSKQSVRISAQQNIIDLIETDVNNGVWKIKTSQNIHKHEPIKIYITVPSLNYAHISGSGDIVTENKFTNIERLKVGISGSGGLQINAEAQTVDAHISGSGDIDLSGRTDELELHISGSGDIDADDMTSQAADVHISGSGGCRLHADKELNVHVSGSGDVYYSGNPSVQSRISGSGDLRSI